MRQRNNRNKSKKTQAGHSRFNSQLMERNGRKLKMVARGE